VTVTLSHPQQELPGQLLQPLRARRVLLARTHTFSRELADSGNRCNRARGQGVY
jgi:hypothetical protein